MVNPQLLQYVRAQRTAGVSKEDIIKALAGGGWSAQDAQEAFAAVETPQPPVAPRPVPPPAPVVAPQPVQVRSAPTMVVTPQPLSSRMQPAAVVQPRPGYTPQPKKRRWPWVFFGLLLFFILGAGAGAYAAVAYPFVGDFVKNMVGIVSPQSSMGESMMQQNEQPSNNFLEVSPNSFDILPTEDQNGSSTPATSTPAE